MDKLDCQVNDIYDFLKKYENKLSNNEFFDLKKCLENFFKYEIFYFVDVKVSLFYQYIFEYIYCNNKSDGILILIRDCRSYIEDTIKLDKYKKYLKDEDNIRNIYNDAIFQLEMKYDINFPDYDKSKNEFDLFKLIDVEYLEIILNKYKIG